MSRLDEAIQAKKEKRTQLEAAGVKAHPYSYPKQDSIAESLAREGQTVQTAGRLMAKREHGGVIFFDLKDPSGSIQLLCREQELAAEEFAKLALIDPGDFLGVEGEVMTTRTGETTILVKKFTFLGKALRPLPSAWNAPENKENRYRQRYLDMLINEDVKEILDTRWLIEKEMRRYLQDEHGFVEVETPVLQPIYGGTNARPFTTHMNALDSDFYLRVAPELYLKRLIVGGYEKIFEIARNFRNEGIDQTHQPEFTMIEWYEAYADYQRMMNVTEGLIKHLVEVVRGSTKLEVDDHQVDLSQTWPRITMLEAIKKYLDFDFAELSDKKIKDFLTKNQIELTSNYTRGKAQFAIFDKLVTPQLIDPIWIIDYPRDVSPLAKAHRLDPQMAERFEGYIGGKELADGWSEIVDPLDQRQIFANEQQRMREGDDEAHPTDEDFLRAMEYGLPPLGGIGIGIDRLVMFITNTWNIKEVIAFPTLRPLQKVEPTKEADKKETMTVTIETNDNQLPKRELAEQLLTTYIEDENLRHHARMVATAMAAYAQKLDQDQELWYQTGLLHDLDWEKYPEEHPKKAIEEILAADYPTEMLVAIAGHAPQRTGLEPKSKLARYLYACDELSGFIHAYGLMRPTNYEGMKASKVKKKMKDSSFAAGVNRADIERGLSLIEESPAEHINFLIKVFNEEL